jgi:hypothetical protein
MKLDHRVLDFAKFYEIGLDWINYGLEKFLWIGLDSEQDLESWIGSDHILNIN